jgi:hypothetical protein
MRNRREDGGQVEPEKDQNGRFADAVVAASRGGDNRGLIDFRIYELPHIRLAVLHSPHQPVFSVYFHKRSESTKNVTFELNRRNPDSTTHTISRLDRNKHIGLEREIDFDAGLLAVMAAKPEFRPELTERELSEAERVSENIGQEKDFLTASGLGPPDARPNEAEAVIEVLKLLQDAQAASWIGRIKLYRDVEKRIRIFHILAA